MAVSAACPGPGLGALERDDDRGKAGNRHRDFRERVERLKLSQNKPPVVSGTVTGGGNTIPFPTPLRHGLSPRSPDSGILPEWQHPKSI
jgi:hypothetical protein